MLAFVVLAWALAFSQSPSLSTEELFQQASQALAKGDFPAAESAFQAVLRREPRNIGALGNLGVALSKQNRPYDAIAIYRRALHLAPNEPGLLLNLALAYAKLDDYASALPLFSRLAASASPLAAQAREWKPMCLVQLGRQKEAIPELEELAALPRASTATLHALALAYVKDGDRSKAQPVFDRLLEKLPPAQVWYGSAVFDSALQRLEKAKEADPNTPGLDRELGKTQLSLRNIESAESAFLAALDRDSTDLEARYFLGALLVQKGDSAAGRPHLESVARQRPDLWGTSYYLGKAELALGNPRSALPLLREAARRAPQEASVQYQLARALQSLGRKVEADQVFRRVASLQSQAASETIVMK